MYAYFRLTFWTFITKMVDILHGPMKAISPGSRDEIQLDSITCSREEQLQRDSDVLLTQLIKIDEEMGTDDIDLLKFICRDHIGGKLFFVCISHCFQHRSDYLLDCLVRTE